MNRVAMDVIGIVCNNPRHPKGRTAEVGMFGCRPDRDVWDIWPFVRGVTLQFVGSDGTVWDWPTEHPPEGAEWYQRLSMVCPLCHRRYVRRWPVPSDDALHGLLNERRAEGRNIVDLTDLAASLM